LRELVSGLDGKTRGYSHPRADRFLEPRKQALEHELEEACKLALAHDVFRLKTIRTLLKEKKGRGAQVDFLSAHPVIRDLTEYEEFVNFASESMAPSSFQSTTRTEKHL